jgi:hypothetical protein
MMNCFLSAPGQWRHGKHALAHDEEIPFTEYDVCRRRNAGWMPGIQPHKRFKMKRLLLLAGVLVLLASSASCASLPKPKGEGSSLVIGSLVLDFPDGFFDEAPRKIEGALTVNFRNVTTDRTFSCFTERGGIFCFLTNGSDEFLLESYEYMQGVGATSYSIGETPLKLKILPTADKVIYLGHITITYSKPAMVGQVNENSSWNFKRSIALNWDKDSVLAYIVKKQPKSEWLTREVIEYNKK